MKKPFIFILLFFFIMHFVIPGAYYLQNGFAPIYSALDDQQAILKTFFLNAAVILLSILVILLIPTKKTQIPPSIYNLTPLYYAAIIINFGVFILKGGFAGSVTGQLSGSFLNYLVIFLNPSIILMMILFYQKKKFPVGFLLFSFILYITAVGSRSAIMILILMLLIFPGFENFNKYKRKMGRYALFFLIASPVMFVAASRSRGIDMDLLSNEVILKSILGRLSMIELGALPVHFKDINNYNVELFNEKYGIINQLKLMFDSLIPGNVFQFDVYPNQYYRALFMDQSIEFVQENYTSMNMTLPVYFYMFTGSSVLAVLLPIGIIVCYYLIWQKYSNNIIISIALVSQLYTFLYSFDFVMWFTQVTGTVFSILMIKVFIFLRKETVRYFKNTPTHENKIV